MPLISTRGTLSSRGFGLLNGGKAPVLTTYTFPAGTSTFTVPATTTSLVSAVGAGADGSPGGSSTSPITTQIYILSRSSTSYAGGIAETYEGLLYAINYWVSVFNQGGTVYYDPVSLKVGPNNLTDYTPQTSASRSNIVAGSAYAFTGGAPTSGPVTYASVPSVYNYRVIADQTNTYGPSTGASTTGFGLTFPGGAGGASSTTSFSNVAVTPNQTYTIQNNKSLTITYYA